VPNLVEIEQTVAELWRFFDFSKMAAVRHLGFAMRVLGPPAKGFGGLYHCANLVGIDAVVSIICKFLQRAAMLALQALY